MTNTEWLRSKLAQIELDRALDAALALGKEQLHFEQDPEIQFLGVSWNPDQKEEE